LIPSVSVERRRIAGRRRRAKIARESGDARVGQAELSLYFAAALLFLVMALFSFRAKDHVAAATVTLQAGTVLLVSPELLRPLRGLPYFNRPLSEIRAKSRRYMRRGAIVFVAMLVPLAFLILGPSEARSDGMLFGALDISGAIVLFFGLAVFVSLGMINMIFEGPAEGWMQKAVGQLGFERASQIRLLLAGVLFLSGTLLLFGVAYSESAPVAICRKGG
jgi:hypothetical protein